MKISHEDYDRLDTAVGGLDVGSRRQAYRSGDFPRADAVKDLDKRYRWDLFWMAVRQDQSILDMIGQYKDSHLDTALRAIVEPLGVS